MSYKEKFFIVTALLYLVISCGTIIFEAIIEERCAPDNKMISFLRKIDLPLVYATAILHCLSMAIWVI